LAKGLTLALAALLAAPLVGCNPRRPAMVSAPRITGGYRVTNEQVAVRCDGAPPAPLRCELDASYSLEPPNERSASTIAVFSERAEVSLEAGAAAEPLPEKGAQLVRDEATGDSADPGLNKYAKPGSLSVTAVTAPAAAALPGLTIRAQLHPEPQERFRLHLAAPLVRHSQMALLFGLASCQFDDEGCIYHIDYLPVRPDGRAAGSYSSSFLVDAPSAWRVQSADAAAGRAGDRVTMRVGDGVDGDEPRVVTEVAPGPPPFVPGGPYLGLGALIDAEPRFKWRVGYEVFAPYWIAHAISVEGDADAAITIAPSAELMSDMFLVIPSLGAGLGMPIQLSPHVEAGARFQLSAQYPLLGVVATVDLYPSRKRWVNASLYGQLAL